MTVDTLTKNELAKSLRAAHGGLSLGESLEVVDAILESILDGLSAHGRVKIRGFGTFEVRMRKRRMTTHPETGQRIEIPESFTIRFRQSTGLFSS